MASAPTSLSLIVNTIGFLLLGGMFVYILQFEDAALATKVTQKIPEKTIPTTPITTNPNPDESVFEKLTDAQKLLKQSDEFFNVFGDFSTTINQSANVISTIVETTNQISDYYHYFNGDSTTTEQEKSIQNKLKKDVSNIEMNWQQVFLQVESLREELENMERSFDYFNALDTFALGIKNEENRAIELKNNQVAYEWWTEEYDRATTKIESIDELIDNGSDAHKIMVLNIARRDVLDDILRFKSIAEETDSLLHELLEFSTKGKEKLSIIEEEFVD